MRQAVIRGQLCNRLWLIMAIADTAESAVAILSIEDTLLIKEVLALVGADGDRGLEFEIGRLKFKVPRRCRW